MCAIANIIYWFLSEHVLLIYRDLIFSYVDLLFSMYICFFFQGKVPINFKQVIFF